MTTEVTLFTRPGCHLCEAVEQVIETVRLQRRIDLVVRDIRHDPADLETYKDEIPVVWVNGVEIARYRLTIADLEAAIDRLAAGPPRK